jgi:hypothetical protein
MRLEVVLERVDCFWLPESIVEPLMFLLSMLPCCCVCCCVFLRAILSEPVEPAVMRVLLESKLKAGCLGLGLGR